MARTDDDSWDLASSVGSTATMVAAQRAISHREGLIDDPYAEPLVRAVGLDDFTRALGGETALEDVDPRFNLRRAAEGMAVRTRHFDRLFTGAAGAGVRQAVILAAGLDARRIGWRGRRGRPSSRSTSPRSSNSRRARSVTLARSQRRTGAPSPSTFATTGRKHCWTTVSTRTSQPLGRPRGC
jgi:Leucine carboxyl methyltransferase